MIKQYNNYINNIISLIERDIKVIYDEEERINNFNNILSLHNEQLKEEYYKLFGNIDGFHEINKIKYDKNDKIKYIIQYYSLFYGTINKIMTSKDINNWKNIIFDSFQKLINRITYNQYNNSYSIDYKVRKKNHIINNKDFILGFILFLKNLRGDNINIKDFFKYRFEFQYRKIIPYKLEKYDDNISFKTFKHRKVLTIYFHN